MSYITMVPHDNLGAYRLITQEESGLHAYELSTRVAVRAMGGDGTKYFFWLSLAEAERADILEAVFGPDKRFGVGDMLFVLECAKLTPDMPMLLLRALWDVVAQEGMPDEFDRHEARLRVSEAARILVFGSSVSRREDLLGLDVEMDESRGRFADTGPIDSEV